MMTSTLATRQIDIAGYNLSVTTRDNGDDPVLLEELTFRTIGAFLYLAGLLEKGIHEAGVTGSVEARLAAEKGITFSEAFVDPRVTVWDSYRGTKNPSFHLNSDDEPQVAMNTYMAHDNAIRRAIEKYGTPQNATQTAPATVSSVSTHETPTTTQTPQNGVISATRAPNPNTPTYAPGQQVSFMINKIVLGVHPTSGSVIYSLWGALGRKYAIKTIYRTDTKGEADSPDYSVAAKVLEALQLAIPGKTQAEGNWRMVVSAAHVTQQDKSVKEYLNLVSLEPV